MHRTEWLVAASAYSLTEMWRIGELEMYQAMRGMYLGTSPLGVYHVFGDDPAALLAAWPDDWKLIGKLESKIPK